jgi:HSP20 family protein
MYLVKQHPFNRLLNEMNTWFGETADQEESQSSFRPRANLESREKEYVVSIELPGVKKDEVTISVENGMLNVSGEKNLSSRSEDSGYYLEERISGKFCRSFRLSTDVDEKDIKAEFENGVLSITLPKRGEALKKMIEIK